MGEPVDKNLWGELEPEEGVPSRLGLDVVEYLTMLHRRRRGRIR